MLMEQDIPVVKRLKGASVVSSANQPLGRVVDVLIHPTAGRWLGVLITTTEGSERVIPADCCEYTHLGGFVTTSEHALTSPLEFARSQPHSVPICRQIIGAQIVTERGELLGYVGEVLLELDSHATIYHVAVADWRRFFKLGFYLAGDAPHYYSPLGARLLVSEKTRTALGENRIAKPIPH